MVLLLVAANRSLLLHPAGVQQKLLLVGDGKAALISTVKNEDLAVCMPLFFELGEDIRLNLLKTFLFFLGHIQNITMRVDFAL